MTGLGSTIAARVGALYAEIIAANPDSVPRAAQRIASAVREDRLVYAFGPGAHSHLGIQDVFYRPGMLAAVAPVLDEATLLTNGARASTRAERTPGRGEEIVAASGIGPGDVALVVNTAGVNATVVEIARAITTRGAQVVGFSSRACERDVDADHPGRLEAGTALSTLAATHVDTCVPPGDAETIDGGPLGVPLTTAAQSFALTWTLAESARLLGPDAPVWASSYSDGGDAHNAAIMARYAPRVVAL